MIDGGGSFSHVAATTNSGPPPGVGVAPGCRSFSIINELTNIGIEIVQSAKPLDPRVGNVNSQITSTLNGLKLAKILNYAMFLKLRSKQCFLI